MIKKRYYAFIFMLGMHYIAITHATQTTEEISEKQKQKFIKQCARREKKIIKRYKRLYKKLDKKLARNTFVNEPLLIWYFAYVTPERD